jgi:glutathione S-transferase
MCCAAIGQALDVVDEELARRKGPYFLGGELSLVDITFTPFLERMVAR